MNRLSKTPHILFESLSQNPKCFPERLLFHQAQSKEQLNSKIFHITDPSKMPESYPNFSIASKTLSLH